MQQQDAVEETYDDVKMLIHKICRSFMRRKRIHQRYYEDWHAEACLAFVRAYQSYNQLRGRFSTWLWHSVWNALSEQLRTEAVHHLTPHLTESQMNRIIDNQSPQYDKSNLDSSLSQDAKAVMMLLLDTFGHIDSQEEKPGEIRLSIHDLLSSLGWSFRRIVESFREIQIALTE